MMHVDARGRERARVVGIVDRPDAHAQTRRRALASIAVAARGERGRDVGVEPRVAVLGRDRAAARDLPGRASATRWSTVPGARTSRARSTAPRSNDETITIAASVTQYATTASIVARITEPSRSASGSHGRHFTSTFTTRPRHASNASARVGDVGPAGAQLGERQLRDRPDTLDVRVMVTIKHAVGAAAHVELDTVGAELARPGERRDRVLGRDLGRRTAVTEHEWPTTHRGQPTKGRVRELPETRSTLYRVRPDQTPCNGRCSDIACCRRQLPGQPTSRESS